MKEFTRIATITFASGDEYVLSVSPDASPTGRLKNEYLLVGPGGTVYQGEKQEVWLLLQNHALAELPSPSTDEFGGRLEPHLTYGIEYRPPADSLAGRLVEQGLIEKPRTSVEKDFITGEERRTESVVEFATPVRQSSVIANAGHDSRNDILSVQLQSGKTYHYQDVPRRVFWELIDAWSPGFYYNRHIKGMYEPFDAADAGVYS